MSTNVVEVSTTDAQYVLIGFFNGQLCEFVHVCFNYAAVCEVTRRATEERVYQSLEMRTLRMDNLPKEAREAIMHGQVIM